MDMVPRAAASISECLRVVTPSQSRVDCQGRGTSLAESARRISVCVAASFSGAPALAGDGWRDSRSGSTSLWFY